MFLAYRWARTKYQERRQEHDDAPPAPPASFMEIPLQQRPGPGAGHAAALEASASFEASPITTGNWNQATTTTREHKSKSKPKPKPRHQEPSLTPEEKAEKHRRQVYRWKVVIGLFAPFLLQSLDTTIIAAALPFIAKDFSKPPRLSFSTHPSPSVSFISRVPQAHTCRQQD